MKPRWRVILRGCQRSWNDGPCLAVSFSERTTVALNAYCSDFDFVALPVWQLIRVRREPDRSKPIWVNRQNVAVGGLGPRRQNARVNRIEIDWPVVPIGCQFFVLPGPMMNAVSLPHGQISVGRAVGSYSGRR